jgi:glutathione S-transferase
LKHHLHAKKVINSVIVFEELGIPYTTKFLDFGNSEGGVEHPDFLKKNAAGRVPLINDPATGKQLGT